MPLTHCAIKNLGAEKLLILLLTSPSLIAAPISWSPAADTTGKEQLIEGNVILAVSGGTAASVTGGGSSGTQNYIFTGQTYGDLTFSPSINGNTFADSSEGTESTGDNDFDTVIKSLTFSSGGVASGTQILENLTDGVTYRVQIFFNDQRSGTSGRVMTYGDGESPGSTIDISAGGSGWGQHAIGTFTANGTSQSLTHATNGFNNIHINALLVTQTGPPPAPAIPQNPAAFAGDTLIALDWDDNTQFGFSNFIVRRATQPGGPYTDIPGATPTTSSYTDTGLTNGTTYYYVIATKNSLDQVSADSTEASATPDENASTAAPPNFIFIIADDMDTYSVNAYRQSEPVEPDSGNTPYAIDTPNIDSLATDGMIFHQARLMGANSGAVCTPSRTCIMTGKSTWERTIGVSAATTFPGIFNRGVRTGNSTLPYATYRTCKNGNSYATANNEFTIVNDSTKRGNTDDNGSEWHGDRGLEHLTHWQNNHRANGKPFLMYLGFSHPHDERNARESPDLTGRYSCVNTTAPQNLILNHSAPPLPFNHLPVNQTSGIPANYPFHPFDHGHLNVRDENTAPGILQYRSEAVVRNEIGRNFACVDWMDQQIGRVLARLEDPNGDGNTSDSIADNTYVIFTSDHGIAIGRHGLQGKQNLYEHTWRVPYIVRGPGIAPGSSTDALIYLHDTFPTLCDLAGLDLPGTIDENDGKSFRPVLEGTATTAREEVYGLYAGGDKPGMRAITDGRFKMIKYDVDNNGTQVTQLFDIATNPFELLPEHGTPNIATDTAYARVRARLEEKLMAQRLLNADPYQFLGDRTLLRFEEGIPGQTATVLEDHFPWKNDGTNFGGTYSSDIPRTIDLVNGEPNTLSLRLTAGDTVSIPTDRALSMGSEPFTLEAYVKLQTLPASGNAIPIISKGTDYLFYAGGGSLGNSSNGLTLRLNNTNIHSSLAITDTDWHYISVSRDPVAGIIRFALNDQVEIFNSTATGTSNSTPVTLAGGSFNGFLDEVSITNGFLALEELQPIDPTPPEEFSISEFTRTQGDAFSLTFGSVDTRLYTIEKSPNLLADSWEEILTFVPGQSGATQTTVSNLPADPSLEKEFYRVRVAE